MRAFVSLPLTAIWVIRIRLFSRKAPETETEERGWVMTGPQRNVDTSQHQFTSALCWITEEESVEKKNTKSDAFFLCVTWNHEVKVLSLSFKGVHIHIGWRHRFHTKFPNLRTQQQDNANNIFIWPILFRAATISWFSHFFQAKMWKYLLLPSSQIWELAAGFCHLWS